MKCCDDEHVWTALEERHRHTKSTPHTVEIFVQQNIIDGLSIFTSNASPFFHINFFHLLRFSSFFFVVVRIPSFFCCGFVLSLLLLLLVVCVWRWFDSIFNVVENHRTEYFDSLAFNALYDFMIKVFAGARWII